MTFDPFLLPHFFVVFMVKPSCESDRAESSQMQPRLGPRPGLYKKTESDPSAREMRLARKGQEPPKDEPLSSWSALERRLRLRGEMLRTAFNCIERLNDPFCPQELIQNMRAEGFVFVGDPNVSIKSALQKLFNRGILGRSSKLSCRKV